MLSRLKSSPLKPEKFICIPKQGAIRKNAYLYRLNSAKMKKTIVIIFALLLALASCRKAVEYPVEPRIEYRGFSYLIDADSTFTGECVVSFSYTDGDGDLGLDDSDTLPPFGLHDAHYYNMEVDYMKSVNGVFVETPLLSPHVPAFPGDTLVLFDTVTFNARFRRLRDSDVPKAISGTMDYKLTVRNPFSPNDTVKFEIRIIDRALHQSNVIQTDPIITNPEDLRMSAPRSGPAVACDNDHDVSIRNKRQS